MSITLPENKLHSLKKGARQVLEEERVTVHKLAWFLGMTVAAHPASYITEIWKEQKQELSEGVLHMSQT